MTRLERVLIAIGAVLLIVIIAGTAYAGLTDSRTRKLARATVPIAASDNGVFDGLGRIRAKSADDVPAVIVVDIAFPYDASDRQFSEELSRKRRDLREATTSFLSGKRATELHPSGEATIKAGLRDTLNALLSLGSIDELYFSEFRVIN